MLLVWFSKEKMEAYHINSTHIGDQCIFFAPTSSFLQSKWGASSLLQLNLQNHELYIAHNPITQDIHSTFIFFYLCINDC